MALSKVGYHSMIINVATGIGTEATITIYDAGTENLSTIYSDADGASRDNSFLTDGMGRFSFFANPGNYDIRVSGADIMTYKIEGVSLVGISKHPTGKIMEISLALK